MKSALVVDQTGTERIYLFNGDMPKLGKGVIYTYDPLDPDNGSCVAADYEDPVAGPGVRGRKSADLKDWAVLDNGGVLMVGGITPTDNDSVNDNIAMVFNPGADAQAGTLTATQRMNIPRKSCTCLELSGGAQVLAVCGTDEAGDLIPMCEIFTTATNDWANAASVNTPRSGYGFAVLQDGRCVIFGGTDADSNVLDTIEIYDPASDVWTLLSFSMRYARTGLRACLLNDGTVLVFGGKDANGLTVAPSELFTP